MKRVMALWNKLAKKIQGVVLLSRQEEKRTKRSLAMTPPSFPEMPQPKERPKDRYTVLVLGESGDAKQLALSKSRMKTIAACGAGTLILLVVLALGMVKYFTRQHVSSVTTETTLTHEQVAPNQQALSPRGDMTASTHTSEDVLPAPISSSRPAQGSKQPGTAYAPAEELPSAAKTGDQKTAQTLSKDQPGESTPPVTSSAISDVTGAQDTSAGQISPEPFLINFDAQQVTATLETPNNGTLSFRLVKDQPDIKFAGYLFVYVEMEDQRGENRIYVYPKQTRLGEGDLPYDFRDGETVAFKYNSRVELPYGDPRPSASLSAVSILLYGENGKIVFQRTFGRQEVAMVTPKANKAEQPKPRTPEKRQAL